MVCDPALIAERGARGGACGRPTGSERHFLAPAVGRALGGYSVAPRSRSGPSTSTASPSKPITRRVWARQGQRPIARVNHRYQWLYLYGFVEPGSVEVVWYLCNTVNIEAFQKTLEAFARELGAGTDKIHHPGARDGISASTDCLAHFA